MKRRYEACEWFQEITVVSEMQAYQKQLKLQISQSITKDEEVVGVADIYNNFRISTCHVFCIYQLLESNR